MRLLGCLRAEFNELSFRSFSREFRSFVTCCNFSVEHVSALRKRMIQVLHYTRALQNTQIHIHSAPVYTCAIRVPLVELFESSRIVSCRSHGRSLMRRDRG